MGFVIARVDGSHKATPCQPVACVCSQGAVRQISDVSRGIRFLALTGFPRYHQPQ
jgi:hypothetical protein